MRDTDLLVEGEGANVILIGSPDEIALSWEARNKGSVFSLIGKTGVRDLPNVLQASDLFIGNKVARTTSLPDWGCRRSACMPVSSMPLNGVRSDRTRWPCAARYSPCFWR